MRELLHLPELALDIALVAQAYLHLLRHGAGQRGPVRVEGREVVVAHLRAAQQRGERNPRDRGCGAEGLQRGAQLRRGRDVRALQPFELRGYGGVLRLHGRYPLL